MLKCYLSNVSLCHFFEKRSIGAFHYTIPNIFQWREMLNVICQMLGAIVSYFRFLNENNLLRCQQLWLWSNNKITGNSYIGTIGRVLPWIQHDIRINPDRFESFQDVIQSNTIPRFIFWSKLNISIRAFKFLAVQNSHETTIVIPKSVKWLNKTLRYNKPTSSSYYYRLDKNQISHDINKTQVKRFLEKESQKSTWNFMRYQTPRFPLSIDTFLVTDCSFDVVKRFSLVENRKKQLLSSPGLKKLRGGRVGKKLIQGQRDEQTNRDKIEGSSDKRG